MREKGTVKWFNGPGYGFIQRSTGETFSSISRPYKRTVTVR